VDKSRPISNNLVPTTWEGKYLKEDTSIEEDTTEATVSKVKVGPGIRQSITNTKINIRIGTKEKNKIRIKIGREAIEVSEAEEVSVAVDAIPVEEDKIFIKSLSFFTKLEYRVLLLNLYLG